MPPKDTRPFAAAAAIALASFIDAYTFADDIADIVNHLDLKDVTLVGFSMGGGDIARYVARHGTTRVAKFVLLSAVTPLFVKTSDHDGVDKSVFDGIKAGLIQLADHARCGPLVARY